MLGDLDTAAAVAVDLGRAGPFAMAGLNAMLADADIVVDDPVRYH